MFVVSHLERSFCFKFYRSFPGTLTVCINLLVQNSSGQHGSLHSRAEMTQFSLNSVSFNQPRWIQRVSSVIKLPNLHFVTSTVCRSCPMGIALCISANAQTVLQAEGRFIYKFLKWLGNSYET